MTLRERMFENSELPSERSRRRFGNSEFSMVQETSRSTDQDSPAIQRTPPAFLPEVLRRTAQSLAKRDAWS